MDLGIKDKHALVCGASRGIGYAAALRLAREGADLTLVARSRETLAQAAAAIRADTGRAVNWVSADTATMDGRLRVISSCAETDILVTHSGIPQQFAQFQTLQRDDWLWWFEAHFFSALELIRAYLPGMKQRKFGRVVNVSANFIKFPQVNAGHSHAARLALAGAIAAVAREVVRHNVTINSVLPGLIDTQALREALRERAARRNVPYATGEAEVLKGCPAGRIADPQEAGDLIAMLASAQMGFLTCQNIVNDGGSYPGLF